MGVENCVSAEAGEVEECGEERGEKEKCGATLILAGRP